MWVEGRLNEAPRGADSGEVKTNDEFGGQGSEHKGECGKSRPERRSTSGRGEKGRGDRRNQDLTVISTLAKHLLRRRS